MTESPFDARELVGLLADDDRRRAVAALVLGASSVDAVKADTGLDTRSTARAVQRLVVLDWLAQRFEPGRHYPERTVNAMLAEVHPDTAALRRYLVDDGLLERERGEYWRSGGTFDPD